MKWLAVISSLALPLVVAQQQAATPVASTTPAATNTPATSVAAQPQTTVAPAATTPAAAATTTTTPPPSIVWDIAPVMTACSKNIIAWTLENEHIGSENFAINLFIYNSGVDQASSAVPSTAAAVSTTTSSAQQQPQQQTSQQQTPAQQTSQQAQQQTSQAQQQQTSQQAQQQTTAAVTARAGGALEERETTVSTMNATIVTGYVASLKYQWITNVRPGNYRVWGILNDTQSTFGQSAVFRVVLGSDTSCLGSNYLSSTSHSTTHAASSTGTGGASASDVAATKKSSGLSGGAIAGIVIGVLVGGAIVGILLFFCLRRRRRGSLYSSRGGRNEKHNDIECDLVPVIDSNPAYGHSMGLSSMGSHGRHNDVEKPIGSNGGLRPSSRTGRDTALSNNTDMDPFETAPSTPIEDKTALPGHNAPVDLAAAAAMAHGARRSADGAPLPPPNNPSSVPLTPSDRSGTPGAGSGLAPDRDDRDDYRLSAMSGVVDIRPGSGEVPASSLGPQRLPRSPWSDSPAPQPSLPTTPTAAWSMHSAQSQGQSAHKRMKSVGSESFESGPPPTAFPAHVSSSASPQSHAPSSFQSTPRTMERKTSLRRKPVPQLGGGQGNTSPNASPRTLPRNNDGTPRSNRSPSIPHDLQPSGTPGDQFGLNAALQNVGKGTFQLIPDPPSDDYHHH